MSIQNRATLKQEESDFIGRVAPYDGNPLIQKSEDLTVRNNKSDSVVFKKSTIAAINNPSAAFAVDFTINDEYNIAGLPGGTTNFIITISNLENNSIGKINITKATNQKITFANATILFIEVTDGQEGKLTIEFLVYKNEVGIFAVPLYSYQLPAAKLATDSVTSDKILADSVTDVKIASTEELIVASSFLSGCKVVRARSGACQMVGSLDTTGLGGLPATIATIVTERYRPRYITTYYLGTLELAIKTDGKLTIIASTGSTVYDLSGINFLNGN